MILEKHVWRTADGRLVWDGDPDASILAYPRATEIPDSTARKLGLIEGGPDDDQDATEDVESELARLRADNDALRAQVETLHAGAGTGGESEQDGAEDAGQPAPGEKAKPAPANKARTRPADK